MEKETCRFCQMSEEDWRGKTKDVDFGVLGKGIIAASTIRDKKKLEIVLTSPDDTSYFRWEIPVNYCPVCGQKL